MYRYENFTTKFAKKKQKRTTTTETTTIGKRRSRLHCGVQVLVGVSAAIMLPHSSSAFTTTIGYGYRRHSISTTTTTTITKAGQRLASISAQSTSNNGEDILEFPTPTTTPGSGLFLPSHPDTKIQSIMAPMVAASDFPFRHFLQTKCGVDLVYTQMLHAKNFVTDESFRRGHLDLFETGILYDEEGLVQAQKNCLGDLPIPPSPNPKSTTAPLMVQLAGSDVDLVLEAADMLMDHTNGKVSGFDLNCGCPQGIARKGNYGAFLMEKDSDRVCEILTALRKTLPSHVAVSAKIRLPVDDDTLKERIAKLLDTGIDFMTIHGRTLHENKTKVAACHIDRIRLAVETAHKINSNFPIVANGGMEDYEDVSSILQQTGAVAAMSSEALLETPNIFSQSSKHLTPRERVKQQVSFATDYLNVCATVAPPLPGVLGLNKTGSISVIRGHLFKFLHRYLCEQPDFRDRLAGKRPLLTIGQAQELVNDLSDRYDSMSDEALEACRSSRWENSWYRRHRKPDRHVHQKETRIHSAVFKQDVKELSVEDRKIEIRERLKRLKEKKQEGQGKVSSFI